MVKWPSYFYNGNPYTGKMASLYWGAAEKSCHKFFPRLRPTTYLILSKFGRSICCGKTSSLQTSQGERQGHGVSITSSNGNIFRVTGPLCGEFTGTRWIPCTKASDTGALMFSLICTSINGWVNNGEAGDLRHHHAHYDVNVMQRSSSIQNQHGCYTVSLIHHIPNEMVCERHLDFLSTCHMS